MLGGPRFPKMKRFAPVEIDSSSADPRPAASARASRYVIHIADTPRLPQAHAPARGLAYGRGAT